MGLNDQQVNDVKRMSDNDLIAKSGDQAFLLETNFRMKRSMERLTRALIWLTFVLVVLTLILVALALEPEIIQGFHFIKA